MELVGEAGQPRDGTQRKVRIEQVRAGGRPFTVVTLQTGPAPEVKAEGEKVVVGGQTISFDGRSLVLEK